MTTLQIDRNEPIFFETEIWTEESFFEVAEPYWNGPVFFETHQWSYEEFCEVAAAYWVED